MRLSHSRFGEHTGLCDDSTASWRVTRQRQGITRFTRKMRVHIHVVQVQNACALREERVFEDPNVGALCAERVVQVLNTCSPAKCMYF